MTTDERPCPLYSWSFLAPDQYIAPCLIILSRSKLEKEDSLQTSTKRPVPRCMIVSWDPPSRRGQDGYASPTPLSLPPKSVGDSYNARIGLERGPILHDA